MAIPNSPPRSLTSSVVIIVLILQEIAAQPLSPADYSTADNMTEPIIPENQTIRVDPLDSFKKYRGGFNMTNDHYWNSVVFTGIYGYAIGVIWLLCGMVCGVFLLTINFCRQSDEGRTNRIFHSNFKSCDLSPIPLAIMLMLLALAASGVVLAGSAKFHSQAKTSIDIIIKTANDASEIIRNATGSIQNIQEELVESDVGSEASKNLHSTADEFNVAAENILKKARKNKHIINKDFKVVFVITVVITSLNLIAVTTLSVSGILGFWKTVYLFVLLCWLMTVICWLLFGVYYFLENFSNDACTALSNFQENPYNNSLSSILPCNELLTAKSVLSEVGAGIYNFINEVNSNITNLQGILLFQDFVYVCNPFSKPPKCLYQPENCSPNTIKIGDIPKVLRPYTCFDDERCSFQDFISASEYGVVESYTSSIQNLLNVYPSMEHLLGCQLVKDAFSEVLLKHCKPLKNFARMTWLGMVCLAAIMVFFVVLWTIKALHDHSYHVSDGSVQLQPHSVTGNA